MYKFKRGFASKIPSFLAESKYGLKPLEAKKGLVWLAPDGKSLLTNTQAVRNNARRRAALNLGDSWADFKAVQPEQAKLLGWNGFQKQMRGTKGSKISTLQRFQFKFGLDFDTVGALKVAADGDKGENNGWGDSG